MLTQSRIEELLDYASIYGTFDENTPIGTPCQHGGTPFNLQRRSEIIAYKKVLGLLPDVTISHAVHIKVREEMRHDPNAPSGLTEVVKAQQDATIIGTGYLAVKADGTMRRIDPSQVTFIHRPTSTKAKLHERIADLATTPKLKAFLSDLLDLIP